MSDKHTAAIGLIIVVTLMICCQTSPVFAGEDIKTLQLFEMSFEELMRVRISGAGKKAESIGEIPASVVLITRLEIEKYGYRSLEEILQNIPGFYMIDDYFWLGSVNFGVRGFFSTGTFNDVIILVNGVNQVGDSWSDYPTTKINIPVEAIDRIEVIRGPMSVIYGSGAFMGAINIITNESTGLQGDNMITATSGAPEHYSLYSQVEHIDEEFNYTLIGSAYHDEGIDERLDQMTSSPVYLENVGLEADETTGDKLDHGGNYINFSASYKNLGLNITSVETRKGIFDGLPSTGEGTDILTNATVTSFNWTKNLSDFLIFKGSIGYSYYQYSWRYEILMENSFATNSVKTSAWEIESDLFYQPVTDFDLTFGLSRRTVYDFYQTYNYPVYGDPYTNTESLIPDGENVISNALFLQARYRIHPKLMLLGGIRFEQQEKYDIEQCIARYTSYEDCKGGTFDNDDIKVIPRLALIWNPNTQNVLKFLYGEATKQPSIMQNLSMLRYDKPLLEPAVIRTFEINHIFSPSARISFGMSLFHNDLDRLIIKRNEYDTDNGTWILYSSNSGRMVTNGVELQVTHKPFTRLIIDISGTYQDSENEADGYDDVVPGYSPKFLGYFKGFYELSEGVSLGITGRYVDRMESYWSEEPVDPDNNDLTSTGRIGDRIDGYSVWSTNVRFDDLLLDGSFANLTVSNLFDREIRYPTTQSNSWADKGTLGSGRRFLLSVGYKF